MLGGGGGGGQPFCRCFENISAMIFSGYFLPTVVCRGLVIQCILWNKLSKIEPSIHLTGYAKPAVHPTSPGARSLSWRRGWWYETS